MASVASVHHPGRSIAIIGGVVVLLVVAAVVAALTLGSRGEATFPAGSPEAAFQSYYRAYQGGDLTAAYGYFSSTVQRQMSRDQYAQYVSSYGSSMGPPGATERLTVDGVTTHGTAATLSLTVEEVYGSGVGVQRYSFTRQVRLVQENGAWKVDEALIGINPVPLELKSP